MGVVNAGCRSGELVVDQGRDGVFRSPHEKIALGKQFFIYF